jgi:hypothetical protein
MARSEDIKTPLARFAFTQHLFKAQEKESGGKQFNVTLLFPKTTDISALQDLALKAAVDEWGDKAKEMAKNGLIKSPFLDGDSKQGMSQKTGERHPGYEGCTFIRAVSGEEYKPKVFDQKRNPIMSAEDLYSGCYGYAVVNAFTWENAKNGKGISFGISLVQKAKDGERLGGGGGADPDKYLETIADEGDAPAETKTGAGAAGLFG